MSEKSTTISQIFHALAQAAYRHASIPYKNRFETYLVEGEDGSLRFAIASAVYKENFDIIPDLIEEVVGELLSTLTPLDPYEVADHANYVGLEWHSVEIRQEADGVRVREVRFSHDIKDGTSRVEHRDFIVYPRHLLELPGDLPGWAKEALETLAKAAAG